MRRNSCRRSDRSPSSTSASKRRQFQLLIHYLWRLSEREQLGDDHRRHTVDFNRLRNEALPAMVKVASTGVIDHERREALQGVDTDDADVSCSASNRQPIIRRPTLTLETMFMSREMVPLPCAGTRRCRRWNDHRGSSRCRRRRGGRVGWLFASVALSHLRRPDVRHGARSPARSGWRRCSRISWRMLASAENTAGALSGAAETLGRGRVTRRTRSANTPGWCTRRRRGCRRWSSRPSFSTVETAGLRFEVVDVTGLVRDVVDEFKRGVPETSSSSFTAERTCRSSRAISFQRWSRWSGTASKTR